MRHRVFEDRRAAGRALASAIERCALRNPIILGLPRGGGEVVCLDVPSAFFAIGNHYVDFGQTTDDEVRRLLEKAWESTPADPHALRGPA